MPLKVYKQMDVWNFMKISYISEEPALLNLSFFKTK